MCCLCISALNSLLLVSYPRNLFLGARCQYLHQRLPSRQKSPWLRWMSWQDRHESKLQHHHPCPRSRTWIRQHWCCPRKQSLNMCANVLKKVTTTKIFIRIEVCRLNSVYFQRMTVLSEYRFNSAYFNASLF